MAMTRPFHFGLVEPQDLRLVILLAGGALLLILFGIFLTSSTFRPKNVSNLAMPYLRFLYAIFLKPHQRTADGGQQSALESFYSTQAAVYDVTRRLLLRGREDMLSLLAAQIPLRYSAKSTTGRKPIWVDVGAGTGWNVEQMDRITSIEDTFEHVYLVDLSPSLCEVALMRVQRCGWKNVTVVCQDARSFRPKHEEADIITMSYSLSMIPDYYSVVESLSQLLAPSGMIGVCDFYVQSIVDIQNRNWIGGSLDRHVNWLGRMFWRAWFDADRVNLDGGRRDFLEWTFGTVLSINDRNYLLGGIPYYVYIGCGKTIKESPENLNAVLTESPYLSPLEHRKEMHAKAQDTTALKSKAYESAVVNLAANLPLPAAFYQNHSRRIYYNDLLQKHQQFGNEYIYAFNWEDPDVDRRLLNIQKDDVILAITSAGDNIMDMLLDGPRRIHAVDLNPNQGHLLELKTAAFSSLNYTDIWKIFAIGRHEAFRELLIHKMSPHMSSQGTQFWLNHAHVFSSKGGLYESGGSGLAIKLVRRLLRLAGLTRKVQTMCTVETLNEQRELWPQLRWVLMNPFLHWGLIGTGWWAWNAAGVPAAQRQMIVDDYAATTGKDKSKKTYGGEAIWSYLVNTFDPVVRDTLLSRDNYFYHICLMGQYSRKSHPRYLGAKAYARLSKPTAFDGLRIHTDEIMEVIARITPSTLSIAILMDSMDWFDPDPKHPAAKEQIRALNKVLRPGGRVLFRSAALRPWYVDIFEETGFRCDCVGRRDEGTCIDRVNMYASTWLCTKTADLHELPTPSPSQHANGNDTFGRRITRSRSALDPLDIGDAAME